ncbi:tetratricopeptide repeat protein [Pedobacter nyackensis]|uniref:TPR repeat-containing protein n=1 Tax=Pedobacter nyackensis TaxID=475255 RepID=A0A1W2AHK5_9SPHI|nr:tetratricopeptide repeat protein [Pedobacter nyackensis]SMC60185.1 TPR repeat-containing protein [Pedobacter nyackensis]
MKQLIIIIYIVLQGAVVFAQKEKKYIHNGNKLYQQQKYAEAEASYRQSVEKTKESVAGNFNLGDALYKQKKFENAAQKFTEIATTSDNKAVKAQAYHNLGNSLLESKKLEESIEAYKKSLMNNPKDDQTRYNLAYAQEKLKEQQKKEDKNKDKNKDKKDQDKKDQQDKDKQNQDKKDQDKKDQNKDQKDKDKQDQDKKDQDKKDQQGQQPQPDKLSKEDAERMLEALKNEEKNTQDKLKNKKAKGVKGRIVKDW